MDNVKPRLIKCFESVFPELSENEIVQATQHSVSSWDSIAAITLLNVIEEEFGTTMDLEMAGDLDSFEKIQHHLESLVDA